MKTVPSRIARVDVYARGAWVTRRLEVPDLAPGEQSLVVPDVTILADPGSVRATVTGRRLLSVATAVEVPGGSAPPGPSVERVRELLAAKRRLEAERDLVAIRRARLGELELRPALRDEVEGAVGRALAASRLVDELAAALDERHLALEERIRLLGREIEAAQLADAQASSRDRMGTGHPRRTVTLAIAGDGPIGEATVTYAVPAARWWPTYTLRLSDGGRKGSWILEALVAQVSGEDWSGVELTLATADFASDARLPELPSMRLGRAQPALRRGYRPAPAGLDQLFDAYDRAFPVVTAPPPRPAAPMAMAPPQPSPVPMMAAAAAPQALGAMKTMMGGGPPPAQAPARAKSTGAFFAAREVAASESDADDGMLQDLAMAPEPAAAMEPGSGWLDFDRLSLKSDRATRGRLVLAAGAGDVERSAAVHRVDELRPPKVIDPLRSRGDFDHQYVAGGRADVPADGLPHRVSVGLEPVEPRLRWRTVPREAPEVYREADLANPFSGPLLAGPVDVYLDGTLLVATELSRAMDRGASLTVGLGVDERLRVARNARTTEETAGLLGGKTVVDTEVTIDLRSALGFAAEVEVLDRIPTSSDSEVTIEDVAAKPSAERYEQKPEHPIEGGRRWRVTLPPSGETKVVFRYRVSFSSKQELVGGNRRD